MQLNVYNTLGQLVAQLRNEVQASGRYTVSWDGISESGIVVSAGMYIYQFRAGSFTDAKKMLFLK